jgi:phosphoglycolate phosphatase-like HAD superfamily hydrolase
MIQNKILPRVVIFDLDNTLIDEKLYIWIRLDEMLKDVGFKEKYFKEFSDLYFEIGNENILTSFNEKYNLSLSLELFKKLLVTPMMQDQLIILPNVPQMVNYISKKGIKVWIATNGNPNIQKNKLEVLNKSINDKLKIEFCSLRKKKPSPESINFIIENEGIESSQAIFVGDTDIDELAASRARVLYFHIGEFMNMYRELC